MNSDKPTKPRVIVYWLATLGVAGIFLITGIGNFVPFEHIARDMSELGYPAYFMSLLGFWKIGAAIAILIPAAPRLKEWAYAGMILDLTGATFSRLSIGSDALMVVVPLLIALFVISSWWLRPMSRKRLLTPISA